ncbi:MAG: hypothetical protein DLM55_10695 [Acidimicrobiales bacterium]|nr:MAG: hypothetical protein DLM55_10695 [Acidimicrobiales bacterium]
MLHEVLLAVHICAGAVGLVAGLFALHPPALGDKRGVVRGLYVVSLATLVLAVAGSIAAGWSGLDNTTRAVFIGLVGLGAFILFRICQSFQLARRRPGSWQGLYMNHVYFTYISLWEGFVIIAILDSDLPRWLIPVGMVGILLIGGFAIARYQRRVLPRLHKAQ